MNVWRRRPNGQLRGSDLLRKSASGVAPKVADDFFEAPTGAYALGCYAGAFTLSGVAAQLPASRTLTDSPGAYAVTGVAASLPRAFSLQVSPGASSVAGVAVTFEAQRTVSLTAGAYAVAGAALEPDAARLLSIGPGAYAVTGADATFDYTPLSSYSLDAQSGAYALSGQASTTEAARVVTLDQAAFAVAGAETSWALSFALEASPVAYTIGQAIEASLLKGSAWAYGRVVRMTGFTMRRR